MLHFMIIKTKIEKQKWKRREKKKKGGKKIIIYVCHTLYIIHCVSYIENNNYPKLVK